MIALGVALLVQAAPAANAIPAPAEMRRGVAAVGTRTSDAPAMRAEAAAHPPSQGFALGAALQAWRNASAGVDYDTTHVTGDGGDAKVLAEDCSDEHIAFGRLEDRRQGLGDVTPAQALDAAGLSDQRLTGRWLAREAGPPKACRG